MRYLHTMIRVKDLNESLDFYCHKLGLMESHRIESEEGRFSLIYLYAPNDSKQAQKSESPLIELTYNWDSENYDNGRNFGHLAFEVDDIYASCQCLIKHGVIINRPPRDGYMAFIKSPDNISIELLQKGDKLSLQEPWISMKNKGIW